MKKQKFYVVWKGKTPGIYTNWNDCLEQVSNFTDAKYKSFDSRQQAEKAFTEDFNTYIVPKPTVSAFNSETPPIAESISVDGACNMQEGIMEYRGVFTATGTELFRQGPYTCKSNNIGEFLAIVHALAYMKKNNLSYPVYTDSYTALTWLRKRKINSKVELSPEVMSMTNRAMLWLQNNNISDFTILQWVTKLWGEIPADFGRK